MQDLSETDRRNRLRNLCRTDLYFLLRYGLNRPDLEHPWLFDRCREVQDAPNGMLDLWAREHYKSTIITYAKTIQDILATHGDNALGQSVTVGIFSHTRPIAKAFLRQIKRELEGNDFLKDLFPDVLYTNAKAESPKWSEDEGIVVKRSSNPKEATVEAWGLVDGQPTSKHYSVLVYDDVVTRESVTTPDMMDKTTSALELSYNLGAHGGVRRFIGTRYHYNDSYRTVLERGTAKARIYPATHNGAVDGKPVYLDAESLAEKRRDMGPYTYGCQMLQDPKADSVQGFKEEWLKHTGYNDGKGLNIYITVDPAGEKKTSSDYTVMLVIGVGADENYYLLDGIRDRLNLTERADRLMQLHREWHPIVTGYERYGMQADIEHIKTVQRRENYRFEIVELGGSMPKNDRIRRLIPLFEQGRFYLPNHIRQVDYEARGYDLVEQFVEEYKAFPVSTHDDILDAAARICDEAMMVRAPRTQRRASRGVQADSSYNPLSW